MESITTRYRVNVSTSVKGVKTWDCTVESDGENITGVLAKYDILVAQLEKRYPVTLEVK